MAADRRIGTLTPLTSVHESDGSTRVKAWNIFCIRGMRFCFLDTACIAEQHTLRQKRKVRTNSDWRSVASRADDRALSANSGNNQTNHYLLCHTRHVRSIDPWSASQVVPKHVAIVASATFDVVSTARQIPASLACSCWHGTEMYKKRNGYSH